MSTYYHTCPRCGASLDPGERCDCTESPRALSVTPKPARSGAPILWPRRSKAGRKKGRKKTGFPL